MRQAEGIDAPRRGFPEDILAPQMADAGQHVGVALPVEGDEGAVAEGAPPDSVVLRLHRRVEIEGDPAAFVGEGYQLGPQRHPGAVFGVERYRRGHVPGVVPEQLPLHAEVFLVLDRRGHRAGNRQLRTAVIDERLARKQPECPQQWHRCDEGDRSVS